MRINPKVAAISVAATMSLAIAACSSSGGSSSTNNAGSGSTSSSGSTAKITLTWQNNGTSQPLLGIWQAVVTGFHAAHPNITIANNPMQNELFKTKIPIELKSDNPPDIYQQWGGGAEATQIQSGKLTNLTQYVSSWIGMVGKAAAGWQVNGQQYGVPYDQHVVGFWYRKDLFAKAGITTTPTTIPQLISDDAQLKAHGIAPMGLGGQSQWPDAFWWEYFAVRECPESVVNQAMTSQNLSAPCFSKATTDLTSFMATNPFEAGFNGVAAQSSPTSSAGLLANGKVAMELQGDWEPGEVLGDTTNKNIDSLLGWFPFPAIPGGQGPASAVLGGGDGWSCTTGAAEPACAEFLQYIDSTAVQQQLVTKASIGIPANPAAESAITSPAVKAAAQAHDNAAYVAGYFDQALPTNPGLALDAALANFFAGKGNNSTIINSVSSSSGH
ncbi:MAG TPA: ABC transporter substrate-binding protein [Streptosporangiaceae bacterium]|nr:ABC transporter substrate-binding protein [Streptosporangiaceae bacterium]